jgi:uncharacterized protein (TIGR02453 family)
MPNRIPIDEQLFPPFHGFPPGGITFLRALKRNNNRPWFQKHKQEYEELVRFPMQCLVATLGPMMAEAAPEVEFNPRKSIFRIYRDVRFSSNKAPYKTNIAASFQIRGGKSPTEAPGLYVGIEPGEIFIGGGLYLPTGEQLKAIRASIASAPKDLLSVVKAPTFRRRFGEIEGEKLVKAPLGYPKDHPMIQYLRYRQFYVGVELDDSACLRPRFVQTVAEVFSGAMPFLRWLVAAVS